MNSKLDGTWRKASYSQGNGNCAEVRKIDGGAQMRDTKLGEASPVLSFTDAEWFAFTHGTKAGEFDL